MKRTEPIHLPEVSASAFVQIDMNGLETLETHFGPKWYSVVVQGLDGYQIAVMRKLLEVGLHDATPGQVFEALDPETISTRLLDALMRVIKGKSLAQLTESR